MPVKGTYPVFGPKIFLDERIDLNSPSQSSVQRYGPIYEVQQASPPALF
jgi:hypothetical protein